MTNNQSSYVLRQKLAALENNSDLNAGRPKNLKEIAYRRLKEDIVLGKYAFGAVLSPRKLGQELGMSFLPVADALRVLETEGLVETKDRVGTRVRIPTVEDIRGIYTLREALESQAARLCSQRISKKEVSRLKAMACQVDEMYARCDRDQGDKDLWLETTVFHANFHRFIADCAGCSILTRAIENSQVLTFKVLFDSVLRRKKRPRNWHESLVRAIAEGDPQVADSAARKHISYGVNDVLQCLDSLRLQSRWRTLTA